MNVFVRFSGCNLQCDVEPGPLSPGGFACDTEFVSGRRMTAEQILAFAEEIAPACRWMILTGGEPGLQVDEQLIQFLHGAGYRLAIETNGTVALPDGIDWITVSPKVAEHAIKQTKADEVKYVRGYGQALPRTVVEAAHHIISPAFDGSLVDAKTLAWCTDLVRDNPVWRLSVQQHKF